MKTKIGTPRGRGSAKLGPKRGNVSQKGFKKPLRTSKKVKV